MRLRHIEVFSAVMLTGSTNGAAKILNISQPAVSKILQHAEQSVGFPLFLRSKGKLVPTQEALQLQRELTPFDEQLRRIRRLATSLSRGSVQPLRIAATPALAHHLLPQAVARWCRAFPQSSCELSVAHTREIEQALLLDEIETWSDDASGFASQPCADAVAKLRPVCDCARRLVARQTC